jgi:mannose-6-phosphate isomerase-like protein (cupin superfamily)
MIKTIATVLIASLIGSTAAFPAGDPPGFHVWTAVQIKATGTNLARKVDAHNVATETLATVGNRTFEIAHREGSGRAEWHEKVADILMIESGTATVIYGGEIVDPKTTEPGQIRGSAIRNGTSVSLGPGDVIHIPAQVPHLIQVAKGRPVTYFVAKIVE